MKKKLFTIIIITSSSNLQWNKYINIPRMLLINIWKLFVCLFAVIWCNQRSETYRESIKQEMISHDPYDCVSRSQKMGRFYDKARLVHVIKCHVVRLPRISWYLWIKNQMCTLAYIQVAGNFKFKILLKIVKKSFQTV